MSDFDTVSSVRHPRRCQDSGRPRRLRMGGGSRRGALHIPLDQLPARLDELDPDEDLYVICRTGGRSFRAAQWLVRPGILRPECGRRHGPVARGRHAAGVRQRPQARRPVAERKKHRCPHLTRHLHLPRTRGHLHRGGPDAGSRCGGRHPHPVIECQHGAGQGPRRLRGRGHGADRELRRRRRHRHPGRHRHRTGTADPPRSPGAHQLRAGGPARVAASKTSAGSPPTATPGRSAGSGPRTIFRMRNTFRGPPPPRPPWGCWTATAHYDAAICAPIVATEQPGLTVLAENIGDNPGAVTRFVLVGRPGELPEPHRRGQDHRGGAPAGRPSRRADGNP